MVSVRMSRTAGCGARPWVIPALVLALGFSMAGRAPAQDFSTNGFITTWLLLGPYTNPGGAAPGVGVIMQDYLTDGDEVFELNFYPEDGDTVDSDCAYLGAPPCYVNPNTALLVPTAEAINTTVSNPATFGSAITGIAGCGDIDPAGEQDTVNLNNYFGGATAGAPDNVMAYGITYVKNNSGRDLPVVIETASDDAIQVIIGAETVGVHDIGRCPDATGTIHYQDQGVLPKDQTTRVMVKCFDGGGNWAFRFRFRDCASGSILMEPDIEIEPIPPAGRPNVIVSRDLPDVIGPGSQVEVKLDIRVLSGTPGAAVVKETIPFTYAYVPNSASDGGTFASSTITWNLAAPLGNRILTYKVLAPDPITSSVFTGKITVDGVTLPIVGEAGPSGGDPGWIKQWLILDAICQQGGCNIAGAAGNNPGLAAMTRDWLTDGVTVTEEIVVPEDGLVMAPDFQGASAGWSFIHGQPEGFWRAMPAPDDDGCIDFNPMFAQFFPDPDDVMVYAAVYVINPTAQDLVLNMGVGSDDSIKVLVNGKLVYAHTIPRGFCAGAPGGPQDIIDGAPEAGAIDNGPVTLRPGSNLVIVGTFEGDGGWNMACRFQDAAGSAIVLPTSLDPEDYTAPDKILRINRDIDDSLTNGQSGDVTFTLTPIIGIGQVILIEEVPAGKGLTPSAPSDGGVLNGQKITWDLGDVVDVRTISYTLTASASAVDATLIGTATIDGQPVPVGGENQYTGSPITEAGFIKMWNHLGPLAWAFPSVAGDNGTSCAANNGAELTVDWIANESETITESNIQPFPGMLVRPKYGGTGVLPGGGARAAGLTIAPGDIGTVVQDQFPSWKGTIANSDTIDHSSIFVNGFDAEDHMTMSSVYVTNTTGAPIDTEIGIGSDDAMDVWLNDQQVAQFIFCRGWGAANQEQNTAPVTLQPGENRLLIKVTDGCCASGFRLRFRDPAAGGGGGTGCVAGSLSGGLLPPTITLSLESTVNPPPRVERDFSIAAFRAGETLDVSLAATSPTSVSMKITETLPAGSVASAPSDGGVLAGNTIEWNLAGVTSKTVSYKLSPDVCQGVVTFGTDSVFAAGPGPVEGVVRGKTSIQQDFSGENLGQWTSVDIASTGGGAERLADDSVLIRGKGLQIGRTEDQFHYLYVQRNGDWEISTRVSCQEDVNRLAAAGLMARASTEPHSAYVYLYVTPGIGIRASRRRITSSVTNHQTIVLNGGGTSFAPVWLKMKKVGTIIELSSSTDGTTFNKLADAPLGTLTTQTTLPDQVLLGLAVTSTTASVAGLAGYDQVKGVPALPPFAGEPAPAAPQLNPASPGDSRVNLSWSAVAGVAGYNVYRTQPGPRTKVNAALITATSFEVTGLANGTEHCFVVRSSTAGGRESADSNQSCATPGAGGGFKRGDVDANGAVEITDPINLLGFLFLGELQPPCFDAADADDNGALEITDAIVSLGFQFLGDPPPPAPGPTTCGIDPSADPPGADFGCDYPAANCQ